MDTKAAGALAREHAQAYPDAAVGAITRNRPALFERWLDAVALLEEPGPTVIVVVDSSDDSATADIVERFRERPGVPAVDYTHLPELGYARARNRLVERCVDLGVDWVAMSDDDDLPDPGWLRSLLDTASDTGVEAVSGPLLAHNPGSSPWSNVLRSNDQGLPRGAEPTTVWTCNLLVSTSMLERHFGPGGAFSLDFDRGGEDTDLGVRLRHAGVERAWDPDAVVRRNPGADAESLGVLLCRHYVGSQFFAFSERRVIGFHPRRLVGSVARLAQGLAEVALAVVTRDPERRAFAGRRVVCALGNLRGLVRRRPPTWVSFVPGRSAA